MYLQKQIAERDRIAEIAESEVIYTNYYFLLAFECHRTSGTFEERIEDLKNVLQGSYKTLKLNFNNENH